jgi:hypothetical protein
VAVKTFFFGARDRNREFHFYSLDVHHQAITTRTLKQAPSMQQHHVSQDNKQ